jgi:hypothetical protein
MSSDEILSVETPFPDVASLAQGYINRVDGERLLVPLVVECAEGDGIRFVVYLGDGTAAFAGAGRCAQVSDQGAGVPPQNRYETLIDSLELDERSRPVYDYIVAVRNAAYSQGAAEDGAEADEAHVDEDVAVDDGSGDSGEIEVEANEAAFGDDPHEVEVEANEAAFGDDADEPAELEVVASDPAPSYADSAFEETPGALTEEDAQAVTEYASLRPAAASYSSVPPAPVSMPAVAAPVINTVPSIPPSFHPEMVSFIPPPLPTGILQRPARALHWQPAPPRRPTPLPQTGLFRYTGPGLPKPSAPPRPDLDAQLYVTRAPRS